MENVHIKSWIKTGTIEMAHSGTARFQQRKAMIPPKHDRGKSVKVPDYRRFGLCLIGDKSKGLTQVQTKPNPGDQEKS
jgi:hypothetical protein